MDLRFFASDLESSGLIFDMIKQGDKKRLHNFCQIEIKDKNYENIKVHHPHTPTARTELSQCITDANNVFIIHNAYTFDTHALDLFGFDTSGMNVADTLLMSWYMHQNRERHGLEWWGEEFGVAKPKVDDWENLTQEEYDNRVIEDCKIQRFLWMKLCNDFAEIYGCKSQAEVFQHHAFKFLMFKGKQLAEQFRVKWKFDVEGGQKLYDELAVELEKRAVMLAEVMPPVAKYAKRKRPKEPYKINGELSEAGKRWKQVTEDMGIPFDSPLEVKVVTGYNPPNPNSSAQVKDWLFSLGWEPETFEYKREGDKVRKIPQVNKKNSGGLVCESVERLIEDNPNVEALKGLGIAKHRFGMIKGWLENHQDGYIAAEAAGFTNTLRLKHRNLVNIPSGRVPYGKELRSLLVARDGCSLVGSDLSSLENRWKFHYQMPLDPEFVKSQMSEDFDPHLALAVAGGLLTKDDMSFYKIIESKFKIPEDQYTDELIGRLAKAEEDDAWTESEIKRIGKIRGVGKQANYALQYGSGVETLARTAKTTIANARKLKDGYDKLNWTIPKIAAAQRVKAFGTGKYLLNKANGVWYPLKAEKDRFSTLIQGSGAFTLDLWLLQIFKIREEAIASGRLTKGKMDLLGQFHDECIFECFDEDIQVVRDIIAEGMVKVNEILRLNVELGCDIKNGKTYYEIH